MGDADSQASKSDSVLNLPTPTPTFNDTATDDRSFAREVLRLVNGQTEDAYEESLRNQAKEYGASLLANQCHNQSKPNSTLTASTHPRRSTSADSQASRSTGLTSNFSRTSKDQVFGRITVSRQSNRSSLSIKDYDSILSHAQPHRRLSLNLSSPATQPQTPSQSTFSLPLDTPPESSSRKHLIRGLSKLKLRRTDSSSSLKIGNSRKE